MSPSPKKKKFFFSFLFFKQYLYIKIHLHDSKYYCLPTLLVRTFLSFPQAKFLPTRVPMVWFLSLFSIVRVVYFAAEVSAPEAWEGFASSFSGRFCVGVSFSAVSEEKSTRFARLKCVVCVEEGVEDRVEERVALTWDDVALGWRNTLN